MKPTISLLFLHLLFSVSFIKGQSIKTEASGLISVNLQDTVINWDLVIDSSFFKNDFYWLGEIHAIKYSYNAQWVLLKKIHEQTSFKYYLLEGSYINEIYLNKYLTSGDEKYLKYNFDAIKGTMGYNKDLYGFFQKLYEYNQELPIQKKIEIVSIDIEHQYSETDKYIRSLFSNIETPADTTDFINTFIKSKGNYKILYKQLNNDLSADSNKYYTLLKNQYQEFKYLVRNINFLFEAKASSNWNRTRDSLMFENYKIRSQDKELKRLKTFACFGTAHCYLESTKSANWIASLIKKSDPSIKSSTIMMYYSHCEAMRPVGLRPKSDQHFISKGQKYYNVAIGKKSSLKNYSNSDCSLLSINKSPELMSIIHFNEMVSNKVLPDYFQYIVLIKNSPASMPYK